MPFVIDHTVEIQASTSNVWGVITDFDTYGEWNPFVVACRSTLEVGESIDMTVRIFPAFTQKQREMILEHVPGKRLCYGVSGMPLGSLSSRRSHEVYPNDAGSTRYSSHFELTGWLAPVVQVLLGARLQAGFDGMTEALAQRAAEMGRSI